MYNRDDSNYFDLDNFDDDRRQPHRIRGTEDLRQRQPQRRQTQPQRRTGPYVNERRYPKKRRIRKRTRNRIIIIAALVIILAVLIFIMSSLLRGCSGTDDDLATVSTETVSSTVSVNSNKPSGDLAADKFVLPDISDDNTDGEFIGELYVRNRAGFEIFSGNDATALAYAEKINSFAEHFSDDTKLYCMLVPTNTELSLPRRITVSSAQSASQADNIKAAYAALSDKVLPVNCYNKLSAHNSEYLFFKTDYHWTGLGAYYAYTAFAQTNKLDELSLDQCIKKDIEGFSGWYTNFTAELDLDTVSYWEFPYTVSMDIQNDGITTSYDSPYYQYAEAGWGTYSVFLMGDNAMTVLKSGSDKAQKGSKILVIKDNYGSAFVPYLSCNYEEVHIADYRNYSSNIVAYCQENNIKEILFLNGVMSANSQEQLDLMSKLFSNEQSQPEQQTEQQIEPEY